MTWQHPGLVAVVAANGDYFKKGRSTLPPSSWF